MRMGFGPNYLLAMALSGCLAAVSSVAMAQRQAAGALAPPELSTLEFPKADLLRLHPRASIIDQHLLLAERRTSIHRESLKQAVREFPHRVSDRGLQLDVQLVRVPDSEAIARLTATGCTLLYRSPRYPRVALETTDLTAIYRLADLPEVLYIAPEYGARVHRHNAGSSRTGSVDGKASRALGADVVRTQYGVDGRGVKVGVMSDSAARGSEVRDADTQPAIGIAGTLTGTRPQDSGDLPAEIDLRADNANTVNDEGAGMLELVHDIAPGASLAFHTAFISQAGFADGIAVLHQDAACDIVVDDISYLSEPMFQDGIIGKAAAECVASGVPYVGIAGNDTNNAFLGTYRDANPAADSEGGPVFNDLMAFDDAGTDSLLDVSLGLGSIFLVVLQWNQPYASVNPQAGSQIDLDLYLYNLETMQIVARSTNVQGTTGSPAGSPIEIIQFTSFDGGSYGLAINHDLGRQDGIPQNPAQPIVVRMVYIDPVGQTIQGLESDLSDTGGPAIYGHSMAPGVVAVGAVPWWESPKFAPELFETKGCDPEFFTSLGGPLTLYFDGDGNYLERHSNEPDVASVDANNGTFFGSPSPQLGGYEGEPDAFPNFFGTSAAAPNAAAVAALMLQHRPNASPADIQTALATGAADVDGRRAAIGPDGVSGAGLIDAEAGFLALGAKAPTAERIAQYLAGRAAHPIGADRNADLAVSVADCVTAVNVD